MNLALFIAAAFVTGVALAWLVVGARMKARLEIAQSAARVVDSERQRALNETQQLRRRLEEEQRGRVEAETRLGESERRIEESRQFIDTVRQQMEGAYASLSDKALNGAIEKLLHVVKPHLDGAKGEISSALEAKRGEIEALLSPVQEMLLKYRGEVESSEQKRLEAYGGIQEQIRALLSANEGVQREAANLASALRVPNVRGAWGEATLRNCVELAGMSEFCDFTVQETFDTNEGRRIRPDMIVRLPNKRVIAVDSKAPIDAYMEAASTTDEPRKRELLDNHAKNLRKHIDQLSRREYQSSVGDTLDFTVLFLGGEQFLSSALITDPTIFEYAIGKKIYLASPTVLLPLLRAVSAGWKAERAEENARAALEIGQELYNRFVKVFEHIEPIGKSLAGALDSYNKAIKSINTRLVPQAAKLQAHVSSFKELPELTPVEKSIETVTFGEQVMLPILDEDSKPVS
ncbi:MAG TPA: DNA recombination protein RmuC [Thermoanaerobaculia bacterium]|nr:DNA recombination protein RmuC [Thermoanaerobaculia bacterium]